MQREIFRNSSKYASPVEHVVLHLFDMLRAVELLYSPIMSRVHFPFVQISREPVSFSRRIEIISLRVGGREFLCTPFPFCLSFVPLPNLRFSLLLH